VAVSIGLCHGLFGEIASTGHVVTLPFFGAHSAVRRDGECVPGPEASRDRARQWKRPGEPGGANGLLPRCGARSLFAHRTCGNACPWQQQPINRAACIGAQRGCRRSRHWLTSGRAIARGSGTQWRGLPFTTTAATRTTVCCGMHPCYAG
jgi:hypothetical protein